MKTKKLYFENKDSNICYPLQYHLEMAKEEEMKPEVRRFVNVQKRKDTRTVQQMYIENLRKEKRKNKSCTKNPPNSWR